MRGVVYFAACLPFLCGCVMVDVGVTNPVAGLTTVAIAPFFNLSQERAVDGRRFAMAYYTELQKTPGFQVIPVGVVEQTLFDNQLEMNNPDDVLKLSQLLGADAVVVGAVTDYSPYYPPRIGLQVSWYSSKPWSFYPGIPTDEFARELVTPHRFSLFKHHKQKCEDCPPGMTAPVNPSAPPEFVPRGQSIDDDADLDLDEWENGPRQNVGAVPVRTVNLPEFLSSDDGGQSLQQMTGQNVTPEGLHGLEGGARPIAPFPPALQLIDPSAARAEPRFVAQNPLQPGSADFDPRQPLMSYTRMFDGTDPKLTARLRDYVELNGDLRAGGWKSYLYRSEDFIRFSSHVMIVEMLQLHGGEARKRVVFKLRKYR